MTHIETPLEPVAAAKNALIGKAQADSVLDFLKGEYPEAFGQARVRSYGLPGIRQTRWIAGRQQLTVEDVRAGTKFPDAIARTVVADRAARPAGRLCVGAVRRRSHALCAVRQPRAGGGRQHRRRRPLHRRRCRGAIERAGDGAVHRHGRGGRARARSRRQRQRAADRHRALKRRVWDNVERTD